MGQDSLSCIFFFVWSQLINHDFLHREMSFRTILFCLKKHVNYKTEKSEKNEVFILNDRTNWKQIIVSNETVNDRRLIFIVHLIQTFLEI